MLSRLLRQLLFAVLHGILTLCEVFIQLNVLFITWWRPRASGNEIEYLERNVARLERRPQHLVVIVEQPWLDTKELANLALWSLLAGIPYISFYDADGTLKPREDELFSAVEKRKCGIPGLIKWTQRPVLNGYSNGNKHFVSTVNIITQRDGKERMTHLVRDLIQQKVSCRHKEEHYTAEELDPVIKLYYSSAPDPDVVTYCGPVLLTKGLLPWHIRLSEFIPLNKYKSLHVEDFVHVLRIYSKCDQRFGK